MHKLGKFKANQDQPQKQEQPAKPAEKRPEWDKGLSELLKNRTTQERLNDKIKEMEANKAEALKEMKRREQLTEQDRKAEDKKRFEDRLKEMEEQKQQTLRRLNL